MLTTFANLGHNNKYIMTAFELPTLSVMSEEHGGSVNAVDITVKSL